MNDSTVESDGFLPSPPIFNVGAPPAQPPAAAPQVAHLPLTPPRPGGLPTTAPPSAPATPPIPAATHAPAGPGPALAPAASTPGIQAAQVHDETAVNFDDLLNHVVDRGGSDLYLTAGCEPMMRVRGEVEAIPNYPPMNPDTLTTTIYSVMTTKQQQTFEEALELDFAHTIPGQGRFRVNVLRQRGSVGAVVRAIPSEIKSLDELDLPPVVGDFADLPRGLVLVTGPTESGKTTTLAGIIDRINRTKRGHIITIEDPVEFVHRHRLCVVNQREVGTDTLSFQDALKHVLRQAPDVILVGEMRDLETIQVALTLAETGHLVLATLHTQSAQETISRIVDVFPPGQQQQVRTQLAASLQGVVCQTLCKTLDGTGRQAAVEILRATTNIRAMIREGKLEQIQSALQTGGALGMQTLNQSLANLVLAGRLAYTTGVEKCSDRKDFDDLVGGPEGAAQALRALQRKHEQQQMGALGSFTAL